MIIQICSKFFGTESAVRYCPTPIGEGKKDYPSLHYNEFLLYIELCYSLLHDAFLLCVIAPPGGGVISLHYII